MATWHRTKQIIIQKSVKVSALLQTGTNVRLRLYKDGLKYYDLTLKHNGQVRVQDQTDRVFYGPNGISLHPKTRDYREILPLLSGKHIFVIPKGTIIPRGLQLLHEYSDHYSLQAAKKCSLKELNQMLTEFLSTMKMMSRDDFLQTYDY